MLVQVPWQHAVTEAFMAFLIIVLLLIGALVTSIFGFAPFLSALMLLICVLIFLIIIPLFLNLSRTYFKLLFALFLAHTVVGILSYAFQYMHAGLLDQNGQVLHSFSSSLYFSINAWTTIGSGDINIVPKMRFVLSIQAITGLVSFTIGLAILWLWCTENMVSKEMAFFDGNRRHKKSRTVNRMRIRTILGKEKELGEEWKLPLKTGQAYRYDEKREEWISIESISDVMEGDKVLEARPKEDEN